MKRLFKISLLALILIPLALAVVVLMSIEDEPLVVSALELTPDRIERAKQLVEEHDPRKAREGEVRSVSLTEQELNLIGNYVAHTLGGSALISVSDGLMDISASLKVPRSPLGEYLNLNLGLREASALPRVRTARLGGIAAPVWLADFALAQSLDCLYSQPGYSFAEEVIRAVSFSSGGLDVTYQWSGEIIDAVRSVLISKPDQERIKVFQEMLSRVIDRGGFGSRVSLVKLVEPLFALAEDRATAGDPVADNRAALLVLAAYVNGRDVSQLAPDVGVLAPVSRVKATLHGREDLSQHFLTSAALAVGGGSALSQAIGLYKEVDDAQGGSGFSFTDLQADNAGTRFGELAVASAPSAKQLQERVGHGLTEPDLVPSVAGLPEGLSESEFKARYREIGSPAYNEVLAEISKRIGSSPLYR